MYAREESRTTTRSDSLLMPAFKEIEEKNTQLSF